MALKFTTTKKEAQLNGVKVLVYGRMGIGKTRLCTTVPKPLIISCEGGLLSLKNEEEIPVMKITTLSDFEDALERVQHKNIREKFQTICLDSISDIAESVLQDYKKRHKDARQAYGELIDKMSFMVRSFRDLSGYNVYFTAKEKVLLDSDGHVVAYKPSLPGNALKDDIGFFFDEVFQYTMGIGSNGNQRRYLLTKDDMLAQVKDRSGVLNQKEQPHLGKIFKKIANS